MPLHRYCCIGIAVLALAIQALSQDTSHSDHEAETETTIDYGNRNVEWEDGPTSWDEFGHDNAQDVCGIPNISVEEWEAGRYWEGDTPVIIRNVTNGWAALHTMKKQEIVKHFSDVKVLPSDTRARPRPLGTLKVTFKVRVG